MYGSIDGRMDDKMDWFMLFILNLGYPSTIIYEHKTQFPLNFRQLITFKKV